MVLWKIGEGLRGAFKKCGRQNRKVRRSEALSEEMLERLQTRCGGRFNEPERDHIRLRRVGCRQYRKSPGFPQAECGKVLLRESGAKTASPPPESRSRS